MFAERTFRDAYAGLNDPADTELHCRASFGEAIQAAEIARPDMVTLLYEQDGSLAAYAQLRWGAAPGCVVAGTPGEIRRLYVARDRHGTGVARDLMQSCLEEMSRRGSDVAWLGVWERNPRAIAFYRKCGFEAVGGQLYPLGSDLQRDVVMARPTFGPLIDSHE